MKDSTIWFHQSIVKLNDGFLLTGEIITEQKKNEQEIYQRTIELKRQAKTCSKVLQMLFLIWLVYRNILPVKVIYFNREP
jgi:hypothetical protein